jgi:hypothetical protein
MSNVTKLFGDKIETVEEALEVASNVEGLESVLIIGTTKEGKKVHIISSNVTNENMLFLLEFARFDLMNYVMED